MAVQSGSAAAPVGVLQREAERVLAFYSDHFVLPLPAGHRFPMPKYRRLRERVGQALPGVRLREPEPATEGMLALAHTPDYIDRVASGRLTAQEQRVVGFAWSAGLVERARRTTGATIEACRAALQEGIAVNLAGGTHHAHADRGAGYCTFNDAAVAARLMQAEAARQRRLLRVAIVDLDVHQGDGTAAILADDPSVFTLSLHAASNFPFRKARSDLDVALADGTTDETYLAALDDALDRVRAAGVPDLVIYLAGADAHEDDRLGRLKLTTAGMRRRDERVLRFAAECGSGVAVAMAGGYGRDVETTVAVHLGTVTAAYEAWRSRTAPEATA